MKKQKQKFYLIIINNMYELNILAAIVLIPIFWTVYLACELTKIKWHNFKKFTWFYKIYLISKLLFLLFLNWFFANLSVLIFLK